MHNVKHRRTQRVMAGAVAAILAVAIATSAGIRANADIPEDSVVLETMENTDRASDTLIIPRDDASLSEDSNNAASGVDRNDMLYDNMTPASAWAAVQPDAAAQTAPEPAGTEPTGTVSTGTVSTGTVSTGTELTGTEPTSTESTGTEPADAAEEIPQEPGTPADIAPGDGAAIMPIAEVGEDGVNMNGYLTGLSFARLENSVWVTSTTFTTDDQVKGSIRFAEVPTSEIERGGNKSYIDLPAYIDCSGLEGRSYVTRDENNNDSGTYVIEEQSDGTYRIVLTLNDSYVENAGEMIGGNLEFEFLWDRNNVPDEGLHKVDIGNASADITITKTESGGDTKKNHYGLKKSAGSLRYSDDGKKAYIDYTVTLTVKDAVTGPITMHDVLSGGILTYSGGRCRWIARMRRLRGRCLSRLRIRARQRRISS